jgi:ParB family chromosome partitioning protein
MKNILFEEIALDIEDAHKKGNLVYISTEELYPHPDNPRKDLGDLTELADSIRVNGVMQNLTVVPGHYVDGDKTNYAEDGYTVIIGHRRCAASKLAGLTELPCVIVDMSIQDQVSTMLLENMQRSDLTIYEQAEGIQMMFDLGETVETVKKKTGLSDSTIRNRRKLLVFDREAFKKTQGRQVTMDQYLKLTELKDVERANYLLNIIGTREFEYEYAKAVKDEKRIEMQDKLEKILREKAVEISVEESRSKRSLESIYGEPSERQLEMIRSSNVTGKIYWYKNQYGFYLFRDECQEDREEREKRDKTTEVWNRLSHELSEVWDRIVNRAECWIMNEYRRKKGDLEKLQAALFEFYMRGADNTFKCWETVCKKLGYPGDVNEIERAEMGTFIMGCYQTKPEETILKWLMWSHNWSNPGRLFYRDTKVTYQREAVWRETIMFKLLQEIGYEMANEELQYLNGEHEIYRRTIE